MSKLSIAPELHELIMRATRVKGSTNVFSLLPRGHRAGFYFQQRRAILLAHALEDRIAGNRDSTIAIVGAGAAGLTFALAMKKFSFANLVVYEAEKDALGTGGFASHRLIHPDYNRWPMLGSMDPFTSLPLLNWHMDTADNLSKRLLSEVRNDERFDDFYENIVTKNATVTSIETVYNSPQAIVRYLESGMNEKRESFDFVILASGPGAERHTNIPEGYHSYWEDDISLFDSGYHLKPSEVFGTGDGALIDLIRCCAKEPGEAWRIPLGLIGELRHEKARKFRQAQTGGTVDWEPIPLSSIERKIRSHEESIRTLAWRGDKKTQKQYSQIEADFYGSLVNDFDRTTRNFLETHFKPVALKMALKPRLIGTRELPFEPKSAPINKLLLAYLISSNRINYKKMSCSLQKKKILDWCSKSPEEKQSQISICRFGPEARFPVPYSKRSGIQISLIDCKESDLVTESSVESNVLDTLSSLTGGGYVPVDQMLGVLDNWMRGDGALNAFYEDQEDVLNSFFHKNFDGAHASYDNVRKQWVVTGTKSLHVASVKLRDLGGYSGTFLGMPIVYSIEQPVAKSRP